MAADLTGEAVSDVASEWIDELADLKSAIKGKIRVIDDVGDIWRVVNIYPDDLDITIKFQLSKAYPAETPEIFITSPKLSEEEIVELRDAAMARSKDLIGQRMLLTLFNDIIHSANLTVETVVEYRNDVIEVDIEPETETETESDSNNVRVIIGLRTNYSEWETCDDFMGDIYDEFWEKKLPAHYFLGIRASDSTVHTGYLTIDPRNIDTGPEMVIRYPYELYHKIMCTKRIVGPDAAAEAVQALYLANDELEQVTSNAKPLRLYRARKLVFITPVLYVSAEHCDVMIKLIELIKTSLNERGIWFRDEQDLLPPLPVMKVEKPIFRDHWLKRYMDPSEYSALEE